LTLLVRDSVVVKGKLQRTVLQSITDGVRRCDGWSRLPHLSFGLRTNR
jgi:hypothetical protein